MSAAETEAPPARWKWVVWVLIVGVLQAALLWVFSDRSPSIPVPPPISPRIQHLASTAVDPGSEELLRLIDPASSVLASMEGFSGPAWLRPGPVAYEPADQEVTDQWLGPETTNFGVLARDWSRGGRVHLWREPERPRVRTDRVEAPPVPVRSRSSYRIEGDLAARVLATPLRVPSIETAEAITNTVLEVLVNPRGIPFSAVVLLGSGSRAADRLALELIRSARFQPMAGVLPVGGGAGTLERGVIRFYWHSTESTNGARPAAPPGV